MLDNDESLKLCNVLFGHNVDVTEKLKNTLIIRVKPINSAFDFYLVLISLVVVLITKIIFYKWTKRFNFFKFLIFSISMTSTTTRFER